MPPTHALFFIYSHPTLQLAKFNYICRLNFATFTMSREACKIITEERR